MKKVLIFGKGNLYENKKGYIKQNYNIIGFLDNKINISEIDYDEEKIAIYNPQDLRLYMEQDVMIVLMSYQYIDMWRQLFELGIKEESILFGISFPPYMEDEEILFDKGRSLFVENDKVLYWMNEREKVIIENHQQLNAIAKKLLRDKYKDKYPIIDVIAHMDLMPVSREFGLERGTAIDRYYIEKFLEKNRNLIYGDCIEIAENTYTMRFGQDKIKKSHILHLEGWGENAIKGNLETGEGIEEEKYDCVIITQTLMFTFNLKEVARNIYKMLKKGGNAMVTMSGISQISRYDADLWGSYFSFHKDAVKAIFQPLFGKENMKIEVYGNCKIAVAMLCGLCQEDLAEEDFNIYDKDYPIIISAILHKSN